MTASFPSQQLPLEPKQLKNVFGFLRGCVLVCPPPHCLACRDFPQVLACQRSSGIDHKWQPHSEAASSPHSHNTSSSLPLCHPFSVFVSWRKQTQLITMGASNSTVFIFSFGLVGLLFRRIQDSQKIKAVVVDAEF